MGDRLGDEAALCRAWARRLWGAAALRTSDGQAVEVVFPGRRRGMPGPDFGGALIVRGDGGRLEHGDVEVHLHASGWCAHGHQDDPAYARVILHVVLIDDGTAPPRRPDGSPLPTLVLAPYLQPGALGVAAGGAPETEEHDSGPCRVAPELRGSSLTAVLEEAGHARIAAKAAAFEGDLAALPPEDAGQVLFAGLLDAVGYSRNRRPCRALAERVPLRTLQALCAGRPPREAQRLSEAVLLGMAGLLGGEDGAHQALWAETQGLWPGTPLHRDDWQRAAVRPSNQPEARLRGLATVVARTAGAGLLTHILAPLRADEPAPKKTVASLLEVLTVHGDSRAVLGPGRATEMLVNVVLPFALGWAASRDEPTLTGRAADALRLLPGTGRNEVLAFMQERLDPVECRVDRLTALQQQGLLHLYARHCSMHDCTACPLARTPAPAR